MGGESTENSAYKPFLLITVSDEEEDLDEGSKNAIYSSSSWPSHMTKHVSPGTVKLGLEKKPLGNGEGGVLRITQQKPHPKKDDIES